MPRTKSKPNENALSYDSIIKEFIERLSDSQLIKFINAAYGKELPLNSRVYRLWTESNAGRRRLSDLFIRISDNTFHIEIQSYPDNQMVLRMFEYGLRGAMQHGKAYNEEDTLTITFPAPIVFYLRGDPPAQLGMNVVFPHIDKTVSYIVPTISLSDYTLDELTDKRLFPLLMFYPMKYEDLPKNAVHPDEIKEAFIKEVKDLPSILDRLYRAGELTPSQIDTIVDMFAKIAAQTVNKTKITSLKGDEGVMAAVAEIETIVVRDIYAELEESEKKGIVKMLNLLMENGQSSALLKSAAIEAGLSEKEFNRVVKRANKNKTKDQQTTPKDNPAF